MKKFTDTFPNRTSQVLAFKLWNLLLEGFPSQFSDRHCQVWPPSYVKRPDQSISILTLLILIN